MNIFARYKKIFLVLAFLILVLAIGYLLWRLFFKSSALPPTATSTPGEISGLPTAEPGTGQSGELGGTGTLPGEEPGGTLTPGTSAVSPDEPNPLAVGGLTKTDALTNSPVLDPVLSADGHVQYYDQNDGRFYKIDENGKVTLLSDQVFYNVRQIVWAPNKDQAILEYPDGNKILYNFNTKKQVTLPAHWKDFSFSPSSDKIISKSIGLDPENRWLVVANADGSQAKALESIGTKDATVFPSWSPNNQIVAMYTKGVDFDRQEIYFVGLNGENFKSTMIEGRGLQTEWSTNGDRLLYSVYSTRDDLKPRLWVVDASGDTINQNRRSFDLQTWASKCTFASNTEIYCAVPETLEKGAGLFPELADKTKDDLYKIDLANGTKTLIAVPEGAYNISQVLVPTSDDYLYFTDKKTGQLYKVRLR
ncbi:MAG: hypothetical protein WC523_03510 [Patescibacteria group bacterium]|jgi:hypothetical protein